MKKLCSKWLCALLCVVLILGMAPLTAFGTEEEPVAPELSLPEAEETPLPAETEELPEEAVPLPVEEEPVGEADAQPEETPAPMPEAEPELTSEPVEETPLPEAPEAPEEETLQEPEEEAVDEAPVGEDELLPAELDEYADPEDPLYAKYVLQLDGYSSSIPSNYKQPTTRALKNETLRKGIDVSSWQGSINWTKVKNDGVEFAILRCGYRTVGTGVINEDGRFQEYIRGAKAVGLKVGVYIFSQAISVKEAKEEADFILKQVKKYNIDLPLVFDLEHYAGGRFTNANLSRRTITDMCKAFCAKVEAAGYESMVYSNPSTLNANMYPNELGRLWLAHYTFKTSYTARGYEYWQFSDQGSINGISGYVDLDFWFEPKAAAATPTPTPAPSDGNPFQDVKKTDWFYDAVLSSYKAGIVTGVTSKTFQPSGTATRAQVVTMLHRIQKTPKAKKAAAFTDLTQEWYKAAVDWATEQGVVTGYSDTEFRPDRAITRQELVTILYRMKGSPAAKGDLSAFSDGAKVKSWAKDAMVWAVKNKLITGYEDDTLRPGNSASRAEVCAILARYTALK